MLIPNKTYKTRRGHVVDLYNETYPGSGVIKGEYLNGAGRWVDSTWNTDGTNPESDDYGNLNIDLPKPTTNWLNKIGCWVDTEANIRVYLVSAPHIDSDHKQMIMGYSLNHLCLPTAHMWNADGIHTTDARYNLVDSSVLARELWDQLNWDQKIIVRALNMAGKKISAVKFVREVTGAGLLGAKNCVELDAAREKF